MKYFVLVMVLALTLCLATSAMALYTEKWEMDVDMSTAGAGSIAGTALINTAGGSGTYGMDGFDYAGGIATFLDDGSSSGNQGLYFADTTDAILGTSGYTLDMRVKWLAGTAGTSAAKSMGFAGAGGVGRALRIDSGWVHSVSSGVIASGGIDMTDWQDLRVIVESSGLWSIYRTGTSTLVLASPSAGSTPTSFIGDYGFMLGSFGGSSTTLTNYQLDYVRVAQGTDILADHSPVQTPEPGSLLALGSGLIGMAGFAIRRRRA